MAAPLRPAAPYPSLVVHAVWSTRHRRPALPPGVDGLLVDALSVAAKVSDAQLIACGNGIDHVHVLLRYASSTAVTTLVAGLKLATARHPRFRTSTMAPVEWDDAFWAESVGIDDIAYVAHLVREQRRHHDAGMPEAWERRSNFADHGFG